MGLNFSKIFSWFIIKKEVIEIIMVGLDASGKTTILNMHKPEETPKFPTIGFNCGTIDYKDVTFSVMEFGGSDRIRPVWRHYFPRIQALVYVVDSHDRDRIVHAQDDLHNIYLNELEAFKDVILLVLANKQDLPNAMNAVEMTDQLCLQSIEHRTWHIQGTCALSTEGLHEGLDWLYNNLANKNN